MDWSIDVSQEPLGGLRLERNSAGRPIIDHIMLTITSHHPRPLSPAFFHSWQPNNVSWSTPAHVDTLEGMSTCQTPLMIA